MTDPICRDIANRVGELLWAIPSTSESEDDDQESDDGAAGVPATA